MNSALRVSLAVLAAAMAVSCNNGQNRLPRFYGPYTSIAVVNQAAESVAFWSTGADGNTAPEHTIQGAATELNSPFGIGYNELDGVIYVGNFGDNRVLGFSPADEGNTAPFMAIGGGSTGLDGPAQVAYNYNSGQIITVNDNSDLGPSQVLFFPGYLSREDDCEGADCDIEPDNAIYGENSGLQGGDGVTVDYLHDELFVVDGASNSIRVFRLGDSANTYPVRVISGDETLITYGDRLAIDYDHDEIFVTDEINGLLVFGRGSDGNVPPRRHIPYDGTTGLQKITGIAYDHSAEEVYVADAQADSISVFGRLYDGSIAPKRVIAGGATGLDGPVDLVLIP